jgi:TolB-like protein/Flp pilus assembly protein TadD
MDQSTVPRFWFIEEMKRRNVGRVAILYVVVAWLILEPVHVVFHMLEVPVWANRLVIILIALGFVPTIVFAWVYEVTPDGLKPTSEVPAGQSIRRLTGRRLDFAIIVVLSIALAYFIADKFWLSAHSHGTSATVEPAAIGTPVQSGLQQQSVAVLAFADLSEKHDQQYFADGMAEDVLNLLATIPELKVFGRTSSFSFKGKDMDARAIGTALGAAYILEGSVARSGDRVRITAQLLNTRDGSHSWSETFERNMTDVFRLQDEIAARIAQALNLTITANNARTARAASPEAYDYYVRGLQNIYENSELSVDQGLADLQHALAIDPRFAEAAVATATARLFICDGGWKAHKEECEAARQAVDTALRLNPRGAAGFAIRAEIHVVYDWDWTAAAEDVKQAEALGGGEDTTFAAARVEYALGRMSNARKLLDSLLSRSPFDPSALIDRGFFVEYRAGDYPAAEAWIKRALQVAPHYGSGHYFLGVTLLQEGKVQEALEEMQQALPSEGRNEGLAIVYHALGRHAESDAALEEAVTHEGPELQSDLARVYAFRGEKEKALRCLETAYAAHDVDLWWLKGDPLMRGLASDDQYAAFLRKLGLADD